MIKRFCDACGMEIDRNAVSERVHGEHNVRRKDKAVPLRISVEVTVGTDGTVNKGDLCVGCVIDAVASLDPRPREMDRAS